MSISPDSGAVAAAAPAPPAKATTGTTATTAVDTSDPKHQADVKIAPISISPPQAPSAAASNLPSSPPRSRPTSGSKDDASINSQNLAWDQAVLRIEYLVSTMTTPSPYSPILSPLDNVSHVNHSIHSPLSPLAGGLHQGTPNFSPPATPTDFHINDEGRVVRTVHEVDADAQPATKGWPSVSREKVRRKVLQIDTWRAEVAAHGMDTFCACSSPAPMIPTSGASKPPGFALNTTTPVPPPDVLPSSPSRHGSAAIPPPIAIPPTVLTCGFCGHPPSPLVALKSPTVAAGVKKAFVDSFKGLLRGRSGSRKGRERDREKSKVLETSGGEKDKGQVKGGIDDHNSPRPGQVGRQASAGTIDTEDVAFTRTAMYHIDMKPEIQSHRDRQFPSTQDRDAMGNDSNDGDDEEVDLDNMSQSTNPRELLQTNDRLKRAEKLLAKSRGGGPKASGGGEGTKSLPIGDGGGGGSTGFGLGWAKNNGGDRSRKGFGKLL